MRVHREARGEQDADDDGVTDALPALGTRCTASLRAPHQHREDRRDDRHAQHLREEVLRDHVHGVDDRESEYRRQRRGNDRESGQDQSQQGRGRAYNPRTSAMNIAGSITRHTSWPVTDAPAARVAVAPVGNSVVRAPRS